jgi:hypothetical protein
LYIENHAFSNYIKILYSVFFLFPLPSFSCCWLFFLLWSSESWRFRSPLPVAGHLCIPTAPFSHRYLPQQCFQLDLVRASPIDLLASYFSVLALFPVVFCFCLFSLFLVLVFPCIVLSLFVLCMFYFCSSADLLCVSFTTLHLLLGFIPRPPPPPPPRDKFQTHLSVVEVCLNAIGFSLYFCCDFACNNALTSLVWLNPLWF